MVFQLFIYLLLSSSSSLVWQHVMRFAEAAQEVQVHRAKERPKFIEDGFVRGRRKLAAEDFLTPVIPAKKPSLEKLPHNPVAFEEIYSPPGFPTLIVSPFR